MIVFTNFVTCHVHSVNSDIQTSTMKQNKYIKETKQKHQEKKKKKPNKK